MSQHCPKNFSPSLPFVSMNEPLAAELPRGTNQQSGEQMTYWDTLNKENSNLVALFHMSQCIICSPI